MNSLLYQAAQQALEALIENARLLGATQSKKGFGCYSQEDARLERAWHEGIAKHSDTLRAALAEPVQEPVAWIEHGLIEAPDGLVWERGPVGHYTPLYTAPPQRKPLSEDEIFEAIKGVDSLKAVEVARAIEAAHGIGGSDE